MTPAFRAALAKTLAYEGGIADHPADRGGRTNQGITRAAYDAWRRARGLHVRPVDELEDGERDAIYFETYWLPCRCDELPERLAAAVFDMAVNSGTWNAKLALQAAARVKRDGFIGPVTLAAARSVSVLDFLRRRASLIQDVIAERPSNVVFLEGWINRLLEQAWRT